MRRLICLAVFAAIEAAAAPLIGTDLPAVSGSITVHSCCVVAQPFTLATGILLETIRIQVSGLAADPFTLWLTNAVGPGATPSNVLYESSFAAPLTGSGIVGATLSFATTLALAPGTYYLILSSSQTSNSEGWLVSTSTLPSAVGTIGLGLDTCCAQGGSPNLAFPPSSSFTLIDQGKTLAFQLDGSVPEPGTIAYVAASLVAVLLLRPRWGQARSRRADIV